MKCKYCGAEIDEVYSFCIMCGRRIVPEKTDAEPTPIVQSPIFEPPQKIDDRPSVYSEKEAKKPKKAKIVIPIIAACVAAIVLWELLIVPKLKYSKAMDMLNSGNYETAYSLLKEIKKDDVILSNKYDRAIMCISYGNYSEALSLLEGLDYKDSAQIVENLYAQYAVQKLSKVEVGEYIIFGKYEQDNIFSNGKENIKWLVLAKDDDRALLISDKALYCAPYNDTLENVTWENCSLRTWMNEVFFYDAFNETEQARILYSSVSADKNPKYQTNPGNATTDKVFLLSVNEVNHYLSSYEDRKCVPTEYARNKGLWISDDYYKDGQGVCYWLLRSPGKSQNTATHVNSKGEIPLDGYEVNIAEDGIRPAIWISLNLNYSLNSEQHGAENDYILPQSGDKLLTQKDLEGLDWKACSLARNEIYARHGRKFKTKEITEYFETKSWYSGTIDSVVFDKSVNQYLSDIEQKNAAFILAYERETWGGSFF